MTKPPTREEELEGVRKAAQNLIAVWNNEEKRSDALDWLQLALKALRVVEDAQLSAER